MKLDKIVAKLDEKLDTLEKDESISKIAAYINESWEQKANFMSYLLDKYYPNNEDAAKETSNSIKKYIYGAVTFSLGFAAADYILFKDTPIEKIISALLVSYLSMFTAIRLGRKKMHTFSNNVIDYAINTGNFRQDLLDFYKNIKN